MALFKCVLRVLAYESDKEVTVLTNNRIPYFLFIPAYLQTSCLLSLLHFGSNFQLHARKERNECVLETRHGGLSPVGHVVFFGRASERLRRVGWADC